jgi:hypothetical protein
MGSLLLKKHDETIDRARELLDEEIDLVGGGECTDTLTITPHGWQFCSGCDCD